MANEISANSMRMQHRKRPKKRPCIECNSQIFCSYVLALFSTALIVGGAYLAFKKWDHTWLILSVAGVTLMFIGSCMYYCGNVSITESYLTDDDHNEACLHRSMRRKRGQKLRNAGYSGNNLMAGDRTLSDSRSVSQLSLNMIPQYFSALDTATANNGHLSTSVSQSMSCSQIFSVNGQSFLILPISGDSNGGENCIQMQNMFFKLSNNDSQLGKNDEETTAIEQQKKTLPTKTVENCSQPRINKRINNDSNRCHRDSCSPRAATSIQMTSSLSRQSGSMNDACGSTSFWIPMNNCDQRNESARIDDRNSAQRQRNISVQRSGTFRKQNGATTAGNQHPQPQRIDMNCSDNRDQSRLSFLVETGNEVSLTSQMSENTPLITSQDSIQSFQSTNDDNCRVEARAIGTPSSTTFDEASRGSGPCARIRNGANTEKTATPPPSYDEVLSVDLQEDEENVNSTEVLIFGTV